MKRKWMKLLGIGLTALLAAGSVLAEEPVITVIEEDATAASDTDEGSTFVYYGPYEVSDRVYEAPDSAYPQLLTRHHYRSEWSDAQSRTLAYAAWDTPELENADRYATLNEALLQMEEEEGAEADSEYTELADWADQYLDQSEDTSYYQMYDYTSDMKLRRADTQFISLVYIKYRYSGGAHGYTWYAAHTFDVSSGEELALTDIITDPQQLKDVLYDELKEAYPDLSGLQENADYDYWSDIQTEDLVWTLENGTVTFYFAAYSLGAYAEGPQFVSVAVQDYPELFNDRVKQADADGVTELLNGAAAHADVDNDGAPDTVEVESIYSEDGYSCAGISVSVNGQTLVQDAYYYDLTSQLIRYEGRTYLYVFTVSDNDYEQLTVFELSAAGAVCAGTVDYGPLSWSDNESDGSRSENITDPAYFRLMARTSVLGTASVFNEFSVGEDGLPVKKTDELYETMQLRLKTRQEISGTLLDASSGETVLTEQQAVIPSGEMVTVIAVGEGDYADILSDEGVYLRIPIESETYPITSGGIDTEELFEGIMYAG